MKWAITDVYCHMEPHFISIFDTGSVYDNDPTQEITLVTDDEAVIIQKYNELREKYDQKHIEQKDIF